MTEPMAWSGAPSRVAGTQSQSTGANLADILERVLDKGVVIAGDIKINLLDIELLTIKLRLLVASVDKAKEMGIDWWEHDPTLSSGARRGDLAEENERLRDRIRALEAGERPTLAPSGRTEAERDGPSAPRSGAVAETEEDAR
ncbi:MULTISPECIES: gas vesicle protein [Actinoalloteichus]|uniref:Gas vesicle protein n=1 Tax=Actinoalloteichus caeruleus DSM 43889 TaxID=1120930 RepID=A0ABT1JI44_ACTCY|nr:Gas vesicle protein [Actinoalloteichus caeruleus DSM 43889]